MGAPCRDVVPVATEKRKLRTRARSFVPSRVSFFLRCVGISRSILCILFEIGRASFQSLLIAEACNFCIKSISDLSCAYKCPIRLQVFVRSWLALGFQHWMEHFAEQDLKNKHIC